MTDLTAFIENIESRFFRTNMDTGANSNALLIWNLVREEAGLEKLTADDLRQRHVDTSADMHSVEEAREFENWVHESSEFGLFEYRQRRYDEAVAKGGAAYFRSELNRIADKYNQ